MPNTARQFNGKSVAAVIHDTLLGELQIVASKPRRVWPQSVPVPTDDAPAPEAVASPAAPATGPPNAPNATARGKGGRHV